MKFTTLIPLCFNDGGEVPVDRVQAIVRDFAFQFGGFSDEGITKGQWIDPADATLYGDECKRVSVSCDRNMLDEAKEASFGSGEN